MANRGLRGGPGQESIDSYFSLDPVKSRTVLPRTRPQRVQAEVQTPPTHMPPSYKLNMTSQNNPLSYVPHYKRDQEAKMERIRQGIHDADLDDAATLERLETRTMTSEMSSRIAGMSSEPLGGLSMVDARMAYRGYRQGIYDTNLPITRHRENILETIDATSCVIISGMTGCGKTTQVPQYILDSYAAQGKPCKIAVTQPRRIAAISIAKRVCQERGWSPGTYCGYQVARDRSLDVDKTMITYMTTGILLQRLISDKHMNSYTHIILDEVHERDQDTDLALMIVKRFLRSVSTKVKVVLMSATFDCNLFAEYFGVVVRYQVQKCPVISVEGKIYNNEVFYWSDAQLSRLIALPKFKVEEAYASREAMLLVVQLMHEFDRMEKEEQRGELEQGKPVSRGTVLTFLPGLAEIQELKNLLEREPSLRDKKLHILPLHSSITLEEQSRVFDVPHYLYRKVILSTNIAESSITVPDIRYVVDFCLTKNLQTDRETNMTCLVMEWASMANCEQRKGRAGRVASGRCYRLVPKNFYKTFQRYGEPEMRRCPLTQLVLRVKKLSESSEEPRELLSLALSPPDEHEIGKAILRLKEAAALVDPPEPSRFNPYNGEMSFIGEILSSLPLNIELGKLLIFGYMLDCLDDCLIVAASMHTRPIFRQPFKERLQAYTHKLQWAQGNHSDPIATVNAFKKWRELKREEYFVRAKNAEDKWCSQQYLQKKTLQEVEEVISDLRNRLDQHGISTSAAPGRRDPNEELIILKMAMAAAFYPHYFTKQLIDYEEANRTVSGKSLINTVVCKGLPNHHGLLYKSQIEALFSNALPGASPKASFENTKCYIEFSHAPGDYGRIPTAMYVALRMAQLQDRLQIELYDEERSKVLVEKMEQNQRDLAESSNRLRSSRMYFAEDTTPYEAELKSQSEPDFSTSTLDLYVVHVGECGHFWAHLVDREKGVAHSRMQSEVNSPPKLKQAVNLSNAVVNSYCIAPYEGSYYRGIVESVTATSVRVFFIDYGNTETVSPGVLKELLPEFRSFPAEALECYFAHVKPPGGLSEYSEQINYAFNRLMSERRIYGQIYSVEPTARGSVYRFDRVSHAGEQMELHSYLHSTGMCAIGDESVASQQNHQLRVKSKAEGVTVLPEDKWGFGLDKISLPERSGRRLTLIGPWSPIEMRFSCLNKSGARREVKVEVSSVNCVALDDQPRDSHERLMVAATTSVSQSSSKIIMRETTLMPSFHGLPALCCLLFSPTSQVRVDDLGSSYTGALFGLGRDPQTGGAAFEDHDIEIMFDRVIDAEDIRRINRIRMIFNFCMGENRIHPNSHMNLKSQVRKEILELLSRERGTREKTSNPDYFRWTQTKSAYSRNDELSDDAAKLFRLIDPPSLEVPCEENDEERALRVQMVKHVHELNRMAASSVDQPIDLVCELCRVKLTTIRTLQAHVDTRTHKIQEHQLLKQM